MAMYIVLFVFHYNDSLALVYFSLILKLLYRMTNLEQVKYCPPSTKMHVMTVDQKFLLFVFIL